jgi:hypothetical protein
MVGSFTITHPTSAERLSLTVSSIANDKWFLKLQNLLFVFFLSPYHIIASMFLWLYIEEEFSLLLD